MPKLKPCIFFSFDIIHFKYVNKFQIKIIRQKNNMKFNIIKKFDIPVQQSKYDLYIYKKSIKHLKSNIQNQHLNIKQQNLAKN